MSTISSAISQGRAGAGEGVRTQTGLADPLPPKLIRLSVANERSTKVGGKLERAAGIEPASLAWKARVLPLHNARTGREVIVPRGVGKPGSCSGAQIGLAERGLPTARPDSPPQGLEAELHSVFHGDIRVSRLNSIQPPSRYASLGAFGRSKKSSPQVARRTAHSSALRLQPRRLLAEKTLEARAQLRIGLDDARHQRFREKPVGRGHVVDAGDRGHDGVVRER